MDQDKLNQIRQETSEQQETEYEPENFWDRLKASAVGRLFGRQNTARQVMLIKLSFAIFFLLFALVVGYSMKKRGVFKKKTHQVDIGIDTETFQEAWFAKANDQLSTIVDQIKGLKENLSALEERVNRQEKKIQEIPAEVAKNIPEDELLNRIPLDKLGQRIPPGSVTATVKQANGGGKQANGGGPLQGKTGPKGTTAQSMTASVKKNAYPQIPRETAQARKPGFSGSRFSSPRGNGGRQRAAQKTGKLIVMDLNPPRLTAKGDKQKEKTLKAEDLLPVGSFFPVVLLTGVNAPTGMKGMKQPQPVLMEIKDLSVLPNEYSQNMAKCFVTGEATGSLSDERVYIRTNVLSCITRKGKVIEAPVQGFATGEDGKLGLRGKVVSRQGLFIARYLVASFVEGIASAFRYQGSTVQITPLGGTQETIDPSKAFQVGFAGGMSKAVDKLSNMYMKLAEETFPVIEASPGRKIYVVLLKKVILEPIATLKKHVS